MLRTALLILSAITAANQASAQPKNLCALITADDAKTFFGKTADQTMGNLPVCSYAVKGQNEVLMAINTSAPNAKSLYDMSKQAAVQSNGSPKDEQDLGATAFSTSTKTALLIFLLKGNAIVKLGFSVGEGASIPPGTLDKLRVVAKKAASRM